MTNMRHSHLILSVLFIVSALAACSPSPDSTAPSPLPTPAPVSHPETKDRKLPEPISSYKQGCDYRKDKGFDLSKFPRVEKNLKNGYGDVKTYHVSGSNSVVTDVPLADRLGIHLYSGTRAYFDSICDVGVSDFSRFYILVDESHSDKWVTTTLKRYCKIPDADFKIVKDKVVIGSTRWESAEVRFVTHRPLENPDTYPFSQTYFRCAVYWVDSPSQSSIAVAQAGRVFVAIDKEESIKSWIRDLDLIYWSAFSDDVHKILASLVSVSTPTK